MVFIITFSWKYLINIPISFLIYFKYIIKIIQKNKKKIINVIEIRNTFPILYLNKILIKKTVKNNEIIKKIVNLLKL